MAAAAAAPPTPARHKAVHQPPQHTPTVPHPLQTHSQHHPKKGATQAFRSPRPNRPNLPRAHTVARCGTDSGTGEAITSRWTSTSCTLLITVQTRQSWRATLRRQRDIRTTMDISSSMIHRGANCLKVCQGRDSRLCSPMISSLPTCTCDTRLQTDLTPLHVCCFDLSGAQFSKFVLSVSSLLHLLLRSSYLPYRSSTGEAIFVLRYPICSHSHIARLMRPLVRGIWVSFHGNFFFSSTRPI